VFPGGTDVGHGTSFYGAVREILAQKFLAAVRNSHNSDKPSWSNTIVSNKHSACTVIVPASLHKSRWQWQWRWQWKRSANIPLLPSAGITNTLAMQVQQEQAAEAEGVFSNNICSGKSIHKSKMFLVLEETSTSVEKREINQFFYYIHGKLIT
jgi:hypothetical protein